MSADPARVVVVAVWQHCRSGAFHHRQRLLLLLFPEEVGAPVDQIEQGKHERERYPGDDVDAFRPGAFSLCSAWEDDTEKKISPRLEFRDGFRAKKGSKEVFKEEKKSSNRKTNWGVDSERIFFLFGVSNFANHNENWQHCSREICASQNQLAKYLVGKVKGNVANFNHDKTNVSRIHN